MKVTINISSSPKVLTKGNGRIFVTKEEDIERVKKILNATQSFEFEYLPDDFIAVLQKEDNLLIYTHKFDPDVPNLIEQCEAQDIEIFVYSCNEYHYDDSLYLEEALQKIIKTNQQI